MPRGYAIAPKYQLRMEDRYIIYTNDLLAEDNLVYIPVYMTALI